MFVVAFGYYKNSQHKRNIAQALHKAIIHLFKQSELSVQILITSLCCVKLNKLKYATQGPNYEGNMQSNNYSLIQI